MPLQYAYPLRFRFKRFTLSPQFSVTDARGEPVAFAKQKLFKLREQVEVYRSDARDQRLYTIAADRWLDWSASYAFADARGGQLLGRVARRGRRSIWKAHYDVFDAGGAHTFAIREESVVTRMLDGMFGDVPVLGLLSNYVFNPTYAVTRVGGEPVGAFTKVPSLTGSKFELELSGEVSPTNETDIVLSLMMMVLLERDRG